MEPGTCYTSTLISLVVPVLLALWFAQYLIENFFPGITLVDLGLCRGIGVRPGDGHLAEFLQDH